LSELMYDVRLNLFPVLLYEEVNVMIT